MADSADVLVSVLAAALGTPWPPHARTPQGRAAQLLRHSQRRVTGPPSWSTMHSSRVRGQRERRRCRSLGTAWLPRPPRRPFLGCGLLRGSAPCRASLVASAFTAQTL